MLYAATLPAMVSKKNFTSSSERFMPSCLPTAISSAGVGAFTLPMVALLADRLRSGLFEHAGNARARPPSIVDRLSIRNRSIATSTYDDRGSGRCLLFPRPRGRISAKLATLTEICPSGARRPSIGNNDKGGTTHAHHGRRPLRRQQAVLDRDRRAGSASTRLGLDQGGSGRRLPERSALPEG